MDDIEEIENFRSRKGLTIASLASELGVTPYYLGQVLKRKNKLTEGLKARFVALQARQSPSFRDVVPLVVRFTAEEYSQLCRAAGVEQLSPAQAEEFWRARILDELVPQARATVAAALAAEEKQTREAESYQEESAPAGEDALLEEMKRKINTVNVPVPTAPMPEVARLADQDPYIRALERKHPGLRKQVRKLAKKRSASPLERMASGVKRLLGGDEAPGAGAAPEPGKA